MTAASHGGSGVRLSLAERDEIAVQHAQGRSARQIARALGRAPSTISRELRAGSSGRGYRSGTAQHRAWMRARRPKSGKLASNDRLREYVQTGLLQKRSPEQISLRLRRAFPNESEMRVSHETIYQALFVQGRGELRRELAACLRTGRTLRKPQGRATTRASKIPEMVMIADRPAEVADRAVPGHWEGDLIMGAGNRSAIGTLVERSTGYLMLLHLPGAHGAIEVRDQMIAAIGRMPAEVAKSITWDQGIEMIRHREITVATGVQIYFCDPHAPWQRGSNENTNGLLRQYFPKGTDLSRHTTAELQFVQDEINDRPRKRLDAMTPAEALKQLLSQAPETGVATTT
ncbi:IS30 family transposase [Curtobacterium sp. MCBA15_008]|uniref:IS30 family transposase n=1 Tax=Curtobacterium sp. MCBA15_008 TaxID=1898736 RepID=UPI001114073E|nr:IS30 family transposase [Curtobacterium sp. MCBA15_008]